MVTVEQSVVYRCSNGRRYFTKRAALMREALNLLKERTDMDGCHDELRNGEHHQDVFYTDEQWQIMMATAKRYARRFGRFIKQKKGA